MIAGRSVLAIIPARGGSKGVPRKNLRMVAGKPLVAWTIEEGHKSKYIDRLIVSSEDPEIIDTAKRWGCEAPFVRPAHLARDDTPGTAPVLHAVNEVPGYDYVVLLQPTSPLRLAEDIDRCLESCVHHGRPSGVTVTEVDKTPYWMFHLDGDMRLSPVLPKEVIPSRRQEIPPVYALNGAVYVAETDWFRVTRSFVTSDTVASVMPKERSLDVDTEFDMQIADFLLRERTEAGRHRHVHTSL